MKKEVIDFSKSYVYTKLSKIKRPNEGPFLKEKLLLVIVDSTLRLEGGGESAARGRSSEPLFRCIAMVGTFELDL